MKIIQIGLFPINSKFIKGGVESSVYGLAKELAKKHDVVVIDHPRFQIKNSTIEHDENLKIYRLKSSLKNNNLKLLYIFRILKYIINEKPEICHLHSSSTFSLLLYCFLKIMRIPRIITIHGLAHIEKKHILKRKKNIKNLLKYIFQSFSEFLLLSVCRKIIVDTEYVKSSIEDYYKKKKIVHLPDCVVIPQGINDYFFNIECDIESNQILSIGSISKRKGHIELIRAFHKAYEVNKDINLTIAGVKADISYFNEVNKTIQKLELKDKIKVLSDISFEDLILLYRKSSLFILHTQEESQGIVFCEAMAAGMPIIATKVGGVPDVVKEGKGGLLSDYSDIDRFAENIVLLTTRKQLAYTYSEFNKAEAIKYNWTNISEKIIQLYYRIINN